MFLPRTSFKYRIVFLIGSVIVVLMSAISSVLLFQWRGFIMTKETDNAIAVSRTFSATILDAMIFEEKSAVQKENILGMYVDNFIGGIDAVRYVALYNRDGECILTRVRHAEGGGADGGVVDTAAGHVLARSAPLVEQCVIRRDERLGWVMETHLAIISYGRVWGSVGIGFDAAHIRTEIQNAFFLLFVANMLITSAVLVILFVLIQRVTASLEQLVSQIDKIDFMSDIDITLPAQNDEVGFLFTRFGRMVERLEGSKKDLERAQQQIYQAEKLASIGRLASGVAHQVNNPLNGIRSCIYAIQQDPSNHTQTAAYLGLISEGILTIESVVKKLLGFARQEAHSDDIIDINTPILQVTGLFDLRLKEKNIAVALSLSGSPCRARIDSHLFQEVFMNLLLNSYDAVESGGTIEITTGTRGNTHVVMTIRDTGCGIDPADMKTIFDPFFSTKPEGTGTGLGLSVCLGIVESHNGTIGVQSVPGEGTAFTITLPQADDNETAYH